MTFYVALRPIPGLLPGIGLYTPKMFLKSGFAGLKFTWEIVGLNPSVDGRYLYKFDLDPSYSAQEAADIRDGIIDGLMIFGAKLKDNAKAKELAELLTGNQWDIASGGITPKDPKPKKP